MRRLSKICVEVFSLPTPWANNDAIHASHSRTVAGVMVATFIVVCRGMLRKQREVWWRQLNAVHEVKAEGRIQVAVAWVTIIIPAAALFSYLVWFGTGNIELGYSRYDQMLLLHHAVDGYGCLGKGLEIFSAVVPANDKIMTFLTKQLINSSSIQNYERKVKFQYSAFIITTCPSIFGGWLTWNPACTNFGKDDTLISHVCLDVIPTYLYCYHHLSFFFFLLCLLVSKFHYFFLRSSFQCLTTPVPHIVFQWWSFYMTSSFLSSFSFTVHIYILQT